MVFFKQPYTVRSYGKTSWANGSPTSSYTDRTLYLDVQGVTRTNQDEQSGKITAGSLTVYSDEELHPAFYWIVPEVHCGSQLSRHG